MCGDSATIIDAMLLDKPVYMYTCLCTYTHTHTHTCICIYTRTYMYRYVHVSMHICMTYCNIDATVSHVCTRMHTSQHNTVVLREDAKDAKQVIVLVFIAPCC